MEKLLWLCRQKHWQQLQGAPPVVYTHHSGIHDEVVESEPAFLERTDMAIDEAAETHVLELNLQARRRTLAHCFLPTPVQRG